jgi:sulfate transport system permease protein
MGAVAMKKHRGVLPGFGLAMGTTFVMLALIVFIPLSTLFFTASAVGPNGWRNILMSPRVLASLRLTFGAAFLAALINTFMGGLVAWVLVRYSFPGRRLADGLVDLPFALPTAVAGITLTTLYARHGWFGAPLDRIGIKAAFSPFGIVIALTFIGLPFVVRTVQPVLEDLDKDMEEAAVTLGAGRWTVVRRVIFPVVAPALLTGFTLAFARALGEYGSVVFISGNMPFKTEIVSLLIMTKLEQFDNAGASALAVVMLAASFLMILLINLIQLWSRRRQGEA